MDESALQDWGPEISEITDQLCMVGIHFVYLLQKLKYSLVEGFSQKTHAVLSRAISIEVLNLENRVI